VLAVAAAHFAFVSPEVNSKYNITEDVRASFKALIDFVEETDVGVEVGDTPANLVFAPVSSASLFVAF
jgi:ribosome maturation factor RimP